MKRETYPLLSSSIWANETYWLESSLDPELKFPILSPSTKLDRLWRRCRWRNSTQTQTTWRTHCKAYPRIHNLNGTSGDSFRLRTKTVAATTTNAKFQITSKITTGFEYAQSLCLSSNCSAAVSRTNIDGSRIILRLLAWRRNRAAWRKLCLWTNRRLEFPSSEEPPEPPKNGVVSTISSDDRLGDLAEAMLKAFFFFPAGWNPNSASRIGLGHKTRELSRFTQKKIGCRVCIFFFIFLGSSCE